MLIPVLFALMVCSFAVALSKLTISAGIAAALIGIVTWSAGGLGWAAPLLWFFTSSIAFGTLHHVQEKPRNAVQVLCNGGAAALAAIGFLLGATSCKGAFLASLCCATGDTWATEIGTRFGRKHFRLMHASPSHAGPSGVVSMAGFLAGLAGAFSTGAFGLAMGMTIQSCAVSAAIGFAGSVLDSVLGDTVQREAAKPGVLTNNTTNLVTTLSSAVAGYFLAN